MAKNYKQPGDVLEFTAPVGGVESGGGYVIGNMFVVATHDADAGDPFQGQITGVWELPKTASQTYVAGDALYWDADPGALTETNGAGPFIGCAARDAASADTVAEVRLNGVAILEDIISS